MLHPPSQAVTTMPDMTGSGSGWEDWPLFHVLCAESILGTLRLTPCTKSQLGVHSLSLYSLGSLIPRPGDLLEKGGQETLNHGKVHISSRAGSLVTTSTLRWTTLPSTCPHAITSPYTGTFGFPHSSLEYDRIFSD